MDYLLRPPRLLLVLLLIGLALPAQAVDWATMDRERKALIEQLKDSDPAVRMKASKTLAAEYDPNYQIIGPIKKLVENSKGEEQRVHLLTYIAQASSQSHLLRKILDSTTGAEHAALSKIIASKSPNGLPLTKQELKAMLVKARGGQTFGKWEKLLKQVEEGENERARAKAFQSLSYNSAGFKLPYPLVVELRRNDRWVSQSWYYGNSSGKGRAPSESERRLLTEQLMDRNSGVRTQASYFLSMMKKGGGASVQALGHAARSAVIETERSQHLNSLRSIAGESPETIQIFRDWLKTGKGKIRLVPARELLMRDEHDAHVRTSFLDSRGEERIAFAKLLWRYGATDDPVKETFFEAWKKAEGEKRDEYVSFLYKFGAKDPVIKKSLLGDLESAGGTRQVALAATLYTLGSRESIVGERLFIGVKNADFGVTRLFLASPWSKRALPFLIEHLKQGRGVELGILYEIGKLGPEAAAAVPDLIQRLSHEDPVIRSAAASSLGKIGPASHPAYCKLRTLRRDSSPSVRNQAKHAVPKLGPCDDWCWVQDIREGRFRLFR